MGEWPSDAGSARQTPAGQTQDWALQFLSMWLLCDTVGNTGGSSQPHDRRWDRRWGQGAVGTGTGTWPLDIGHLSLARAGYGTGECSDWCFRRLIPCTVAARVMVGQSRGRVRQRAEGRDHDSPQKDEDRSQGTQEPSLSPLGPARWAKDPGLHIDPQTQGRAGQAGQSMAGSRDPGLRTDSQDAPQDQRSPVQQPQAARATQQIEADSPPIDSIDSAHVQTGLGSIQPMIPGAAQYISITWGGCMSVPIARAMAFGGFFEMLGCREALGWPTSAPFSRILLQVCGLVIGPRAMCCALFRVFCRPASRFAGLSVF